jgi:hypothetical protein
MPRPFPRPNTEHMEVDARFLKGGNLISATRSGVRTRDLVDELRASGHQSAGYTLKALKILLLNRFFRYEAPASQIASASLASFFCDFTYGFTTAAPSARPCAQSHQSPVPSNAHFHWLRSQPGTAESRKEAGDLAAPQLASQHRAPDLSAPCTWKTCFAMASPMVVTIFMVSPPRGELTNSLLQGGSIPLGQLPTGL